MHSAKPQIFQIRQSAITNPLMLTLIIFFSLLSSEVRSSPPTIFWSTNPLLVVKNQLSYNLYSYIFYKYIFMHNKFLKQQNTQSSFQSGHPNLKLLHTLKNIPEFPVNFVVGISLKLH